MNYIIERAKVRKKLANLKISKLANERAVDSRWSMDHKN